MRVLIAARLSRLDNKDEASRIERDDQEARVWAEQNGYTVVATSEDRNVSGSTDPFKRPALGPWLTDPIKVEQWDVLVASKLDRLGRNARYLHKLQEWAEQNSKRIIVIDQHLEWPIPNGSDGVGSKIMWELFGILAEWELDTITERQEKARKVIKANHGFMGLPPFGFVIVGEKYAKTIIPDPNLVGYIREMARRALSGETRLAIARWLDSEGVIPPRGGKWSPSSVKNVLSSPALKGRKYDANGNVTHRHQEIMSTEEWDELQRAIDRRPGRRNAKRQETALLTGVITCALCSGPMYRVGSNSKRVDGSFTRYEYYRCTGKDQEPSTCGNLIRLEMVEALVHMSFTTVRAEDIDDFPPELGESFSGMFAGLEVVEQVVVPGDNHETEIAEVAAEIDQLDKDAPDYLEQVVRLTEERRRLQGLPATPAAVVERPTGRTVGDVWVELDEAARRRYLVASGVRVLVWPASHEGIRATMVGDPSRVSQALRTIAA